LQTIQIIRFKVDTLTTFLNIIIDIFYYIYIFLAKNRQLDADGKGEIDDLIDVKLAKLQRKAEEGVESL
jgi:hypothetical protein